MSLTLKVRFIGKDKGATSTKAVRFAENMSVTDALKVIMEKATDQSFGKDHGLYKPLNEDSGPKGGKWLRSDKTLEFYDFRPNDLIELRKKHDTIKVKLVDNTSKLLLLDFSETVEELVKVICGKIGIKNPEEYSLQVEKEGGGNSDWMKKDVSLLEQLETGNEILVLKKKYFVTDQNVDRDDPVQLHLVYIQTLDDVLSGKHPTSRDEAIQLAALQCQIDSKDINPNNPSVILKNCLAPAWQKDKQIDKAIAQEWKKLVGFSEVNAKYRYVQFCRSLKTYGITLYHVQERDKKSKKLNKLLLGFTRDSIVQMTEDCSKIEKTYPLKHLKRWAASNDTFTLDFGSHEDDYVTVITTQGEEMSQLIAGYIDILLQKQRASAVTVEDDDTEVGAVSEVARVSAQGVLSTTTSSISNTPSISHSVVDLDSAARAVNRMINQLFGEISASEANNGLTAEQRKQQIGDHSKNLEALASKLIGILNDPNGIDKTTMNATSKAIAQGLEQLVIAARNASALGMDPDGLLFDGVKALAECLQNLLANANDVAKNPNDMDAKNRLNAATAAVQAALAKLNAVGRGIQTDDAFQKLFIELGRAVANATGNLVAVAENVQVADPLKKTQVDLAKSTVKTSGENIAFVSQMLSPTIQDASCKKQFLQSNANLGQNAKYLQATLAAAGATPADQENLKDAMDQLNRALAGLLSAADLPQLKGGPQAASLNNAAQAIFDATTALMGSYGKGEIIRSGADNIYDASQRLEHAAKSIGTASNDPNVAARLNEYAARVRDAVRSLLAVAPASIENPTDEQAHKALRSAAQQVAEATQHLVNDAGQNVALSSLYGAAKLAAANTVGLVISCQKAKGKISDKNAENNLLASAKSTSDALSALIASLKDATANSESPDSLDKVVQASEKFAPLAYKLVADSKGVAPKVTDPNVKRDIAFNADNTAKSIHKLLLNRKNAKARQGQAEINEAMEQFQAFEADLEAAILSLSSGMYTPSDVPREHALRQLHLAIKNVATDTKSVATAAKDSPEELGPNFKKLVDHIGELTQASKVLTGTIDDPAIQKAILNTTKAFTVEEAALLSSAQSVAQNPQDENLNKVLSESGKNVATALSHLANASKGVIPKDIEEHMQKSSTDIEDKAEKELQSCADVINQAVQKLLKAQQEAEARRNNPGLDLDEQEITEAILGACTAIGNATAVLMGAATVVQREFNKLRKIPENRAVYKRDPAWAQGLISASQEVAGSVKHLVSVADGAARGKPGTEEALIVAANNVTASTTRLVTASTVKSDVNSQSQGKLKAAFGDLNKATKALVEAAKSAAHKKDEKIIQQQEKYSVSEQKKKEMDEQIEILRLERELERKRNELHKLRREAYSEGKGGNEAKGGNEGKGENEAKESEGKGQGRGQNPALPPRGQHPGRGGPGTGPGFVPGTGPGNGRGRGGAVGQAQESLTGQVQWRTTGLRANQQQH